MQNDCECIAWCLPTILKTPVVKYLIMGINEKPGSCCHLTNQHVSGGNLRREQIGLHSDRSLYGRVIFRG